MRVLFWFDWFWPTIGGVQTFATRLLPALKKRGHQFTVVTGRVSADLPEVDQYEGIPVHRFPFWPALERQRVDELAAIRQQVSELKRSLAPDLIHLNYGLAAFFHLSTAKAAPAPVLVTLNGEVPDQASGRNSLAQHVLRSGDWIVGCSEAAIAGGRRLVPEITPHSSCIHYGYKAPPLLPKPLPVENPRILCLGRFEGLKGFDLALSAFASLTGRYPNLRLILAGDGPERSNLEQQTAQLGIRNALDFVGWVAPDKVPELINSATLLVVPSRQEGFGLVALEAALMARPVVATRVGGLPEVVAHGQTGLLVEPDDSRSLANAISFLLDHPEEASQMGQAARRRAREKFGWEQCVAAYDRLYQRMAGKPDTRC
jgi:glycogen(starch) synthase